MDPPSPLLREDSAQSVPPRSLGVQDHVSQRGAMDGPPPLDGTAASSTLEAQPSSGSLRRRATLTSTPIQRGIARVGTIMGQAHAQDFERKRRPVAPEPASPFHGARTAEESSDDEDEEVEIEVEAAGEDERDGEVRMENENDVQEAQEILRSAVE